MTEQTSATLPLFAVRIIEQAYTQKVEEKLKKFVWADKLFDSKGNRKFSIVFAEGTNLEFFVEITTYVKVVMRGVNVMSGGQATLTDIETLTKTVSVLQRAAKHIQSSDLVLYRTNLFPLGKKVISDYEMSEALLAIPKEDAKIVSFSYTVEDTTNGNRVEISGEDKDPPGATLFNARVKLMAMRREDD